MTAISLLKFIVKISNPGYISTLFEDNILLVQPAIYNPNGLFKK